MSVQIAFVGMILVTESTLIFRVRSWLRMMLVSMLLKSALASIRLATLRIRACESNLDRMFLAFIASEHRVSAFHDCTHSS